MTYGAVISNMKNHLSCIVKSFGDKNVVNNKNTVICQPHSLLLLIYISIYVKVKIPLMKVHAYISHEITKTLGA